MPKRRGAGRGRTTSSRASKRKRVPVEGRNEDDDEAADASPETADADESAASPSAVRQKTLESGGEEAEEPPVLASFRGARQESFEGDDGAVQLPEEQQQEEERPTAGRTIVFGRFDVDTMVDAMKILFQKNKFTGGRSCLPTYF